METICENVIEPVVQSVFSTMLQMDVIRMEADHDVEQDYMLSSVQIAGGWMGSVFLGMSPQVSNAAASVMLQSPADDITDADRQDVAAELVNMIGGNIKSMLPGPSTLSLPTIISGNQIDVRVHDAHLMEQVVFVSEAGKLLVRLFASTRTTG